MKNADVVCTTHNIANPEQYLNYMFSPLPLLGRGKDKDQKQAAKEIQGYIHGWCPENKAASLWYFRDLNQSKWQKQLICRV